MRRLRNLLLAASALALFGSAASAADMATKAPQAPLVAAPVPYSWTGFYVGGNVGGGWGSTDGSSYTDGGNLTQTGYNISGSPLNGTCPACNGSHVYVPGPINDGGFSNSTQANVPMTGFVAGGQIGYNYQVNQFLFGAEVTGDWSGQSGSWNSAGSLFNGKGFTTGTTSTSVNASIPWFAMVQARLGWVARPDILLYGKLGYGWVGYDITEAASNQSAVGPHGPFGITGPGTTAFNENGSASGAKGGFSWGGGLEYALGSGWSVKLEYDEIDAGSVDVPLYGAFSGSRLGNISKTSVYTGTYGAVTPGNLRADLTDRMVLFGVNYKFSSLFGTAF
jgi:outer membrane immunogenic protein